MDLIGTSDDLKLLLSGKNVRTQLSVPQLMEKILVRKEAVLTSTGAVSAVTGKYTGRSPKDKFIVVDSESKSRIDWGNANQPISVGVFNKLYKKMVQYLKSRNEIFLFKGFAGADPSSRLPIQVVNEFAWHNLFAHQLFIRPDAKELQEHEAQFTILSAPLFKADPATDGTHSEVFIIISLERRIILIGGTEYAGEMKKSIFSIMNYLLPQKGILSMHCSANTGKNGDTALFFGLSGTGKTTLSADPDRALVGDDEHGWSDSGIFNIEGGCYAKCIGLTEEKEPQIYRAIQFGTVLENVVVDPESRSPQFENNTLTENTRAAYPIENIGNIARSGMAGHPGTIIFLTADASGVLPPISRLTKEQAMYHFLSGYTSKLAGTERGVTSPEAVFSTCFGAPFLPLEPAVYAKMLGEKIEKHHVQVFLVNTGWTGGPYGTGARIKLSYTRAMVRAAIGGKLKDAPTQQDDIFGLHIPLHIDGVPDHVLFPAETWEDKQAYRQKALELAARFKENFWKFASIPGEIEKLGGPLV
ncbi:phosphoenolpyruvate carboxykinase [ATP] [Weizmannia acidilactici]|uniref:Phosphoenolpyruvate carboxykinase (ATP) n=1 Tax=Weizmannia acidilactici TaxID=2607726 RepID=A0A5J4JDI8_9BACI|nr:phosphoenolpyruvate carboxykinase (ATP) [Weizmannia acidilactici]GER66485.1 phosphoenolpyruvate carboxykinase [ATP] [Weizmannia acidilactici]GER69369.1 phosphoenolpyruvate carboxykinase [ATP] [Weizmannia acidilactici]GER72304.1 phosphoenolpyruvate carboxykinase [ATP] [Weizmannia acidilactici]